MSSGSCEILFYLDSMYLRGVGSWTLFFTCFLWDENVGWWNYKDKARSAEVLYIKTKAVIGKHFIGIVF